jgi:hypothetical protein
MRASSASSGSGQIHNEDSALFPLLAEEFHLSGPAAGASLLKAGRAQVVQAGGRLLGAGSGVLQRLQLYIDPVAGRKLRRSGRKRALTGFAAARRTG